MAKEKKNELKLGFWQKLGGWFRTSTIITGAAAVLNPVFKFLVAPAFAASGSELAPDITQAATSMWNGLGAIDILIGAAIPAVVATVCYAIPSLRESMKQKALLSQIKKALSKNKELTLTPEQVEILNRILANPKRDKEVNKIGRERLSEIARTASTKAPAQEPVVEEVVVQDQEPVVVQDQEPVVEQDQQTVVTTTQTTTQTTTNDDLYKKITRKSLFNATTLSAREALELQQIYYEEKKSSAKTIKELEGIENPTEEQQQKLELAREAYNKYDLLERRTYTYAKKLITAEMNDPNTEIPEATRAIYNEFLTKGRRSKTAAQIITDNGRGKAGVVKGKLDSIIQERKASRSGTRQ